MQTIAKITPADYPDLLAAVDAGVAQRELARRYDCVPSLIARHVARARRSREPGEPVRGRDPGVTTEPHTGSMREILEARIRDPKTSPRDLASLANALARLEPDGGQSGVNFPFRRGSIVLEPEVVEEDGKGRVTGWRLFLRGRNGIECEHVGAAEEVLFLVLNILGLGYSEEEARAILAGQPPIRHVRPLGAPPSAPSP